MKNILLSALLILIFNSCIVAKNPIIIIKTELGDIKLELYQSKAPITVTSFLKFVDNGDFKNSHFYRVVTDNNQTENPVKIQVVQGGLYYKRGVNVDRIPGIKHETTKETGILHKKGVISMARNEPGSANTEFFICVEDEPELDFKGKRNSDLAGFAAFGKVIKGMDIVNKIHQLPEKEQMLKPKVKVISISRDKACLVSTDK
jgi:peptidyl-prolyl cis-trans isomerase A (cyclophilin A)